MFTLTDLETLDAAIASTDIADLDAVGELLTRRGRGLAELVIEPTPESLLRLEAARERGLEQIRRVAMERIRLADQHAQLDREKRVVEAFRSAPWDPAPRPSLVRIKA